MTTKDLADYEAIVRETVNISENSCFRLRLRLRLRRVTLTDIRSRSTAYRGSRIFSTVAPSSGAVVLSALKVRLPRFLVFELR